MQPAASHLHQLELEKRRISELGDVLQRIEKHASGELAARLRAEEMEREAADEAAHEREQRARLEEEARWEAGLC